VSPFIRRRRAAALAAVCAVGAVVVLLWPVTTKQGIDFHVTTHTMPLYRKAFEFASRSSQYTALAREITAKANTDEQRALAVFDWTLEHIPSVPEGSPVIDDHILNIVMRGYGLADQQADVFATLTTYAGVPAFWQPLKIATPNGRRGVLLTFVRLGDRWRIFDVANGTAFRNAAGELATLDEVRGNPALVPDSLAGRDLEGTRYIDVITHVQTPETPRPLRAELQMPGPRVWHELRVAAGIETRHEPE
jgi:hypothetical protein